MSPCRLCSGVFLVVAIYALGTEALIPPSLQSSPKPRKLLSEDYLENDLVSIRRGESLPPRLCVVAPGGEVTPLCRREDDVETDLFSDPREYDTDWSSVVDSDVVGTYGEGFYGQRPVPSLGGGPGYGALADDVWSTTENVLNQVELDGVYLPVLDMGIAHGEKARGGSF